MWPVSIIPVVIRAGWYVDRQAILANALGTVIGGLFLTVLYFTLGQKLLRPPRLSGVSVALTATLLDGLPKRSRTVFMKDLPGVLTYQSKENEKSRGGRPST